MTQEYWAFCGLWTMFATCRQLNLYGADPRYLFLSVLLNFLLCPLAIIVASVKEMKGFIEK